MKMYLVTALIFFSIGITYYLGNKYQIAKKKEIDSEKSRRRKKTGTEKEKPSNPTWGEVLQNAKTKGRTF